MAKKFEINDELKSRLFRAQRAEEVAELLRAAGQEADAEDAEHLWQEIEHRKNNTELSLDELEAVSGGVNRDWIEEGCAATVEPGSWCWWGTDQCDIWDVIYEYRPLAGPGPCPRCGGYLCEVDYRGPGTENNFGIYLITQTYFCKACGYRRDKKNPDIIYS